ASPAVKRGLIQTLLVIKNIEKMIKKKNNQDQKNEYILNAISIEVPRENNSKEQKKKIEAEQKYNEEKRIEVKNFIDENGNKKKYKDYSEKIIKTIRLYIEQ